MVFFRVLNKPAHGRLAGLKRAVSRCCWSPLSFERLLLGSFRSFPLIWASFHLKLFEIELLVDLWTTFSLQHRCSPPCRLASRWAWAWAVSGDFFRQLSSKCDFFRQRKLWRFSVAENLTRALKRSMSDFSRTVLFSALLPCTEVRLGLGCLWGFFPTTFQQV